MSGSVHSKPDHVRASQTMLRTKENSNFLSLFLLDIDTHILPPSQIVSKKYLITLIKKTKTGV